MNTPLYFQVMLFGSAPIIPVEAAAGVSCARRYDNRPWCYRSIEDAVAVASAVRGYGTVSAARLAVVYDDAAEPSIALAEGPGWELYMTARA